MPDIKLSINGEKIPLNPIMTTILANINLGFIRALKKIPEDKTDVKIEITL